MKRKRPMPPALAAYWAKRRGKKAKTGRGRARKRGKGRPRSKVTVTTVNSRTVRRTNPRMSVLYAVKGRDRLKYVGGIKFSKRGRAKLFKTPMQAHACANMLRSCFQQALKGFRFEVAGG